MSLSRRSLLRSASLGSGSLLLSPFLQRVQAAAEGKYKPPRRVVFVLQSNGFHPWAAQPIGLERTEKGPDKVVDLPLGDYQLSEDMKPLRPYINRTTIIQRLHGRHCGPWHSAGFGALSGVQGRLKAEAETIDARLARIHPATFPLVNLGISNGYSFVERKVKDGKYACCSAWGKRKPIASQLDPNLAYKALFGGAGQKIDEGQGVLDEMRGDLKRVEAILTPVELEKFAQFMDAFESLDQRQELFQKADKKRLDPEVVPGGDKRYSSSLESKRLEAHFELAGAALISGLTNTVTIASGVCNTNGEFEGLGFDEAKLHAVGHFKHQAGKNWKDIYIQLRQFHFKQIVGLMEKLMRFSDEDGSSMLDNTIIVYTSDGADTHHSDGRQWPFVIVGNWGGKIRSGRFLEYPAYGAEGNRPINALYCALLHAAGVKQESFNLPRDLPRDAGPNQSGPLKELLA